MGSDGMPPSVAGGAGSWPVNSCATPAPRVVWRPSARRAPTATGACESNRYKSVTGPLWVRHGALCATLTTACALSKGRCSEGGMSGMCAVEIVMHVPMGCSARERMAGCRDAANGGIDRDAGMQRMAGLTGMQRAIGGGIFCASAAPGHRTVLACCHRDRTAMLQLVLVPGAGPCCWHWHAQMARALRGACAHERMQSLRHDAA